VTGTNAIYVNLTICGHWL